MHFHTVSYGSKCSFYFLWYTYMILILIHYYIPKTWHFTLVLNDPQGSKFHSSDRLRWVKMAVWQVEYLQDLSDGWLHISDFHISCLGFVYFRQVNGTFGQVIFTIRLSDGQVHSIWNFEAWSIKHINWIMYYNKKIILGDHLDKMSFIFDPTK